MLLSLSVYSSDIEGGEGGGRTEGAEYAALGSYPGQTTQAIAHAIDSACHTGLVWFHLAVTLAPDTLLLRRDRGKCH